VKKVAKTVASNYLLVKIVSGIKIVNDIPFWPRRFFAGFMMFGNLSMYCLVYEVLEFGVDNVVLLTLASERESGASLGLAQENLLSSFVVQTGNQFYRISIWIGFGSFTVFPSISIGPRRFTIYFVFYSSRFLSGDCFTQYPYLTPVPWDTPC
jgi:hypothetical protein